MTLVEEENETVHTVSLIYTQLVTLIEERIETVQVLLLRTQIMTLEGDQSQTAQFSLIYTQYITLVDEQFKTARFHWYTFNMVLVEEQIETDFLWYSLSICPW